MPAGKSADQLNEAANLVEGGQEPSIGYEAEALRALARADRILNSDGWAAGEGPSREIQAQVPLAEAQVWATLHAAHQTAEHGILMGRLVGRP